MSNAASDQTKKILVGAAIATATIGAGYLLYKNLGTTTNLAKELEKLKAEGNEYFKQKNYQKARELFTKGIEIGEAKNSEGNLVAMLYQNRAACREKIGDTAFDILNDCLAALKHDKKYAKAYLRAAKQLHMIGKKQDALTYLLAAFTLDEKLNKSNFAFFDELLDTDNTECVIEPSKEAIKSPAPVSLFRIQQWWDTWDIMDLFKKDLISFTPEVDNDEQQNYRKALDAIKAGRYEAVLELLNSDEIAFFPAAILRAKFLLYSIDRETATKSIAKLVINIASALESIEDEERRRLVQEAFDILRIEACETVGELDKYLEYMAKPSEPTRRFNLNLFAAINVYNGCALDTTATSHQQQMMADTMNTSRYLKAAAEVQSLTTHTKAIELFVKLCSIEDYSEVHKTIRELEELATSQPTHFVLLLMTKVYLMTGNGESARKLLEEAEKINTRCLVAARHLQSADLYLNVSQEERVRKVSECAKKALEVDEFNFSAHILLLLGSNGPEPSIKREHYEEAIEHIKMAAVFAPIRELLMLKKMLPLMNAKKRASELLGVY
ncbi:unnamed protein product [Caenorhabditis bovis]|uniref:Mitochondrial import receptor subunit TOM70 n=1 Tax=Caenorhabditis bovis TaxID=2654633 RepID=A0A8S1ELU1_9PELO|nr:unnamed protein product [Caenorhabditis bovis]